MVIRANVEVSLPTVMAGRSLSKCPLTQGYAAYAKRRLLQAIVTLLLALVVLGGMWSRGTIQDELRWTGCHTFDSMPAEAVPSGTYLVLVSIHPCTWRWLTP